MGAPADFTSDRRRAAAARARDADPRLRLLDAVAAAVIAADPDGLIWFWNAAAEHLLGWTRDAALGRQLFTLLGGGAESAAAPLSASAAHGQPPVTELLVSRRDGTSFWAAVALSPFSDPAGTSRGTVVVVTDISARRAAEATLRQREESFHSLAEHAPDIIARVDRDLRVLYVNPAIEQLTGVAPAELLGREISSAGTDPPSIVWRQQFERVLTSGLEQTREFRRATPAGERIYQARLAPERDAAGAIVSVLSITRDVTELRALTAQLAHDALHDALTSLPNRTLLLDRVQQSLTHAQRRGNRVAVLCCDLDNFKFINDSLGHATGDALLRQIAQRLRAALNEGDTLARLSGDEFVVVLDEAPGVEPVAALAQRLLRLLGQPIESNERRWHVTASIGIVLSDAATAGAEELLRDAETAMYRAKRAGKDRCIVFDATMHAAMTERLEIEHELRRALARGDLRLAYQPQLNLANGEVVGFEALARWRHPRRGVIAPADFIPVAEESGLIVGMGHWVLREACRTARAWLRLRPHLEIAINLSARQFRHPTLLDDIVSAVSETGLPPGALALEITESVIMDDPEASLRTLSDLRALGVRLAIDDFGTGFSSLSRLKRLPVDCLKIDRSFVAGLGQHANDDAIVAAITDMGHAMGLRVVAEGVEASRQRARLEALGCDWAQGYLFAPPGPPDAAARLLGEPCAVSPA